MLHSDIYFYIYHKMIYSIATVQRAKKSSGMKYIIPAASHVICNAGSIRIRTDQDNFLILPSGLIRLNTRVSK
jgi:hypothetical protein